MSSIGYQGSGYANSAPGYPGSGYGNPSAPKTAKPTANQNTLGIYGLPPEVSAQVDRIFRSHPGDANAAAQEAIAYVRGTPWYAQTYPGIADARRMGFIGTDMGSEREYKQTYNALNAIYQQYQNRHMTFDEAHRLFASGATPQFVAQQFQGQAYIATNRADIAFTTGAFDAAGPIGKAGLKAYGLEQAGYDTPLGQKIAKRVDQAAQKMQRVFSGTLQTPGLGLGPAGPTQQQLGRPPGGDVGA